MFVYYYRTIGCCFNNDKRIWMLYAREDSRIGTQSKHHTFTLCKNPYLGNWNNRANIEYND